MSNGYVFSPFLLLTAGALAALLVEAFRTHPGQRRSGVLALLAQGIALALVWDMVRNGRSNGLFARDGLPYRLFSGAIQVDDFTLYLFAAILVAGIVATVAAMQYLGRHQILHREYHSFQLFAVLGMLLLVSSTELITLFLSLELMSLPIYVMCAYRRERTEGFESGLKYFVLGGFAAAILLFGLAHLYGQAHTTNLVTIIGILQSGVLPSGAPVNQPMMMLGLALFAAGVLFKIAAVPMHYWLPDVYEGAPAPVTAFMAAGVKAAAFGVLIKVVYLTCTGTPDAPGLLAPWNHLMVLLACLTMLVPNFIALCQRSPKRILAYSSIAHAGYMLVGVCAMARTGSGSGDPAVAALLYYLMVYGIMTAGAFAIVGELTGDDTERSDLDVLNGLAYRRPFLVSMLALCLLSMIGVPPLAGFWGKYLVFKAAVDRGMIPLAVVAVTASVIAGYYYLRILVHLYMREPVTAGLPEAPPRTGIAFNVCMGAVGAAMLWLGIGWTTLLRVVPGATTLWNWAVHAAQSLDPLYQAAGQLR